MRSNTTLKEAVKVSLYHDRRKKKNNGTYPVRIRVYETSTKKVRLYTTNFDLTEKDFSRIFFPQAGQKLRREEKEIQSDLLAIESEYKERAEGLDFFNFDAFQKLFKVKKGDLINVFWHYETVIQEKTEAKRFGTALTYTSSMRSLISFFKATRGKEPSHLYFQEITPKLLESYETWMTESEKKSFNTVGIYLRNLRAIFNKAINEKIVDEEMYPFGLRKYEIPAASKAKKAFNTDQLEKLFQAIPKNEEQVKARDVWFFSFVCNGVNIKDIVYLKWKNIVGNQIEFIREKSRHTKKTRQKTIQVPLTDFSKGFIEKYGVKDKSESEYVLPVINEKMTDAEKDKRKNNFTRFVNQHLKKLALENGLTTKISTYWARHSFSTSAIRKNVTMEFVSEALGHSDLKTTQNYFAGFEDHTKREVIEGITDFMRK